MYPRASKSCETAGTATKDLLISSCTSLQMPEDDVPMRSVSVASDTSCLVGGNNKVGRIGLSFQLVPA